MTPEERASRLGAMLRSQRKARQMSLRDLADEIGVSFNTLSRVERGQIPDFKNFNMIVDWLGVPASTFLDPEPQKTGTPEVIARHLRSDPSLTAEAVEKIADLVTDMYRKLSRPKLALHLRAHKAFLPEAGNLLGEVLEDMQNALINEGAG
jgi:transcriptional regulator with XRE-family HTH domain